MMSLPAFLTERPPAVAPAAQTCAAAAGYPQESGIVANLCARDVAIVQNHASRCSATLAQVSIVHSVLRRLLENRIDTSNVAAFIGHELA